VANKYSFWIAILWTLLIFFLSLKSIHFDNQKFHFFANADKIVHFTFYFIFVLVWCNYLYYKKYFTLNYKLGIFFISVLIGVFIEFAQKYFTTTRQADLFDVFANTLGSLAGILLASTFFNKQKC